MKKKRTQPKNNKNIAKRNKTNEKIGLAFEDQTSNN